MRKNNWNELTRRKIEVKVRKECKEMYRQNAGEKDVLKKKK
jgi:hypothetical protein